MCAWAGLASITNRPSIQNTGYVLHQTARKTFQTLHLRGPEQQRQVQEHKPALAYWGSNTVLGTDLLCKLHHRLVVVGVVEEDQKGESLLSELFTVFERDLAHQRAAVLNRPLQKLLWIGNVTFKFNFLGLGFEHNLPPAPHVNAEPCQHTKNRW